MYLYALTCWAAVAYLGKYPKKGLPGAVPVPMPVPVPVPVPVALSGSLVRLVACSSRVSRAGGSFSGAPLGYLVRSVCAYRWMVNLLFAVPSFLLEHPDFFFLTHSHTLTHTRSLIFTYFCQLISLVTRLCICIDFL